MSIEERLELVTKNAEEVILEEEVRKILEEKEKPRAYIGFELSGLVHLGTGLVCGNKLKDLAKAGFETIVFLADWHSWINNKLDADLDKIQLAGEYFQKAFESLGVKGSNVKYIWGSEFVDDSNYWAKVIRVAKSNTLSRILRTMPIMGRKSEGEMESAFLYYPAMQAADIFHMKLDLAVGGMDQRKAHMLTRDTAEKLGYKKPASLHTPLLTGLEGYGKKMDSESAPDLSMQIDAKMSKSKPDSCIFIHDTDDEILKKIQKAQCPPKKIIGNPVTEIVQFIIFDVFNEFKIERDVKFGDDLHFDSFNAFEESYVSGDVHPMDVKMSVAKVLQKILKPAQDYFDKHSDLVEEVKQL
ncbi:MAG: tyrosine--tRNA ligase [Candidatus Heimdallarchaeota archaeon]|nr:tyrosine--tRNA ligase [Candidatus Heimdallarchaeota archaeon]MCK4954568.1 tyrosine--tRNA ligase [Candidatus Heimdallarchaeota archaeon]